MKKSAKYLIGSIISLMLAVLIVILFVVFTVLYYTFGGFIAFDSTPYIIGFILIIVIFGTLVFIFARKYDSLRKIEMNLEEKREENGNQK